MIPLRAPRLIVVPQTQIDGQAARYLPIVLEEEAGRVAFLALAGIASDGGAAHRAQQERRHLAAGPGGGLRIVGQGGGEVELPGGHFALVVVRLLQANVRAELHGVAADDLGQRIDELPGGGAAQSDGEGAEAGQSVVHARQRAFGNARRQSEFADPALVEAVGLERKRLARHADARLVQQRRREAVRIVDGGVVVEVVVQPLAHVGIGQGAGESVVVEMLVIHEAPGNRVLVGDAVVALHRVLIHVPHFVDLADPVAGVGEGVGRRAVGQRIELDHLERHGVQPIGGNHVVREGGAHEAGAGRVGDRRIRIVNLNQLAGGVAQVGEIARPHRRCRHRQDIRLVAAVLPAFVVEEEERLVSCRCTPWEESPGPPMVPPYWL